MTVPQGTTDAYFAVAPGFGGGMRTDNQGDPVLGPNSVRVATNPNVVEAEGFHQGYDRFRNIGTEGADA